MELLKRRISSAMSLKFGKKWSEIFTEVAVKAEGPVLSARLYGSRMWTDFLFADDPLLLSD